MSDNKILGKIVSKLDYPIVIEIGGDKCRLSPRAVIKNVDKATVGALPNGITFIPYVKEG